MTKRGVTVLMVFSSASAVLAVAVWHLASTTGRSSPTADAAKAGSASPKLGQRLSRPALPQSMEEIADAAPGHPERDHVRAPSSEQRLDQRFAASERSVGSEKRMRSLLERVFGAHDAETRYAVECRAAICKLYSHAADAGEWVNRLQEESSHEFREFFGHSDSQLGVVVYLEFASEQQAEYNSLVKEIGDRLMASPQSRACASAYPDEGEIVFRVQLDATTRRLSVVDSSGSLASRPGGNCFRGLVDSIVSDVQIGSTVKEFAHDYKLTVPCDWCRSAE